MKKIISIFLCLILCLLFTSCSVSQKEQGNITNEYDYSEDYMSMYRINSSNSGSISTVKSSKGKYYFNIGNIGHDKCPIYELSALDFNKSCENENFLTYNNRDEYYCNYGKEFFKFANLENCSGDGAIELIQTYKNYLYVLINSSIYKINCDNAEDYSKIYPINEDDDAGTFFFYKNEMYILSSNEDNVAITRADLNGNVLGEVINGGAGFPSARNDELYNIYASGDYLYFIMRQDGRESNIFLYCRCKLDGSDKQVWKIADSEFKFVANEKNIATISRHYDYELESYTGLDIEIYNSKDLSSIKKFSVQVNDEIKEWLTDEGLVLFVFPVFYNQNSIEIDINNNSFYMTEWSSQSLIIDTNTELARFSSFNGLITRPSNDETFTARWEMTSDESAKLYFYKVDTSWHE